MDKQNLQIHYVNVEDLKTLDYNPRIWSKEATEQLKESIRRYGLVDPLILNGAPNRKNNVIGGNFRLSVATTLGIKKVPAVYINIDDEEKEKELCIRLNKNTGSFDFDLLDKFDESFLADIGFNSEELDAIFEVEDEPEVFDINKELKKLDINNIEMKTGQVWQLGDSKLMVGDSTIEADMLKLFGDDRADMCLTDPPYLLDYLKGKKKHGKATDGFGFKRDRKYIGTDILPDNFTELWMANVNKIQKTDFSIIIYENWKIIRTIWNEMEKYWKVKNMIVWHLNNRCQGFAAKYKFFNKHDIAMVGVSEDNCCDLNMEQEQEILQNEYESALYAISGKPTWEGYEKGKKYTPTDFIEYKASDEKSSGQGIIFGTKPTEILIPYIKVLTKRGDLIVEPFGGSGSTLIAATKMNRRCYIMEKSPVYAEVIRKRWETFTGKKAIKYEFTKK
jgi:DNA modification methylase